MNDFSNMSREDVTKLAEEDVKIKLKIFVGEINNEDTRTRVADFIEQYSVLEDHIEFIDNKFKSKTAWGECWIRAAKVATEFMVRDAPPTICRSTTKPENNSDLLRSRMNAYD